MGNCHRSKTNVCIKNPLGMFDFFLTFAFSVVDIIIFVKNESIILVTSLIKEFQIVLYHYSVQELITSDPWSSLSVHVILLYLSVHEDQDCQSYLIPETNQVLCSFSPALLFVCTCVPVNWLMGNYIFLIFASLSADIASLSADIAYNYSICILHKTSHKICSLFALFTAITTTDTTQCIRLSGKGDTSYKCCK